MSHKSLTLCICLIMAIFLSDCKRDSSTGWDTGILAPLATTSLTIGNLVKDSILHTNADSSLSLSYQNTVYELNLADQFIHIPDTSIGQKYTVDSLRLPNILVSYNVSLGSMARNLVNSGQPTQIFLGNYIVGKNGQLDSFPAISGFPIAPFNFDAASFFQTATLSDDSLLFAIENELPIPLQNITFQLQNASQSTAPFLTSTIAYIPPHSTVFRGYRLPGITIESSLSLKITSFSTPGTGNTQVLIDTANFIQVRAFITDIRVHDAIAVFPSQDIISLDQELTQDVGPRKFTYIDCKQGTLDVRITNAIEQPLKLTYKMIGAYDKSGHPLIASSTVPAAQGGNLSSVTQSFDLSGFSINLTGSDGTKFNTYTQIILAHIDSTGIQTHITSSDSVHIQYFLRNIRPNYIKGYAGKDTIKYAGTSPFSIADIFAGNQSNALKFDKASISLSIENGIGVDGQVTINNLTSINSNGTAVSLTDHSPTPVIGTQQYIGRATDFPLTPKTTTFNISSATSNIGDFISNLPSKIGYDVQIKTNPFGNRGTYDDFAYLTSLMKVNLNVNIPLSLIANNLTLRDSFNFSLGYSQKDVANIKEGVLHLILLNKFPLQANITLVAYDSSWNMLDTMLSNAQLDAAPVNNSCRATESKKSIIDIKASATVIDKLRFAKHAVMVVTFNTKTSNAVCNGHYLQIYSDYSIDAKITGDFTYKIKL